jgi:hypothetical protein
MKKKLEGNKHIKEETIRKLNVDSYFPSHSTITGKKIENAEMLDLTQDFETVKRSFS